MQITLQVKGSEIQKSLRNKRESEAGNAKPRVGLCIARFAYRPHSELQGRHGCNDVPPEQTEYLKLDPACDQILKYFNLKPGSETVASKFVATATRPSTL